VMGEGEGRGIVQGKKPKKARPSLSPSAVENRGKKERKNEKRGGGGGGGGLMCERADKCLSLDFLFEQKKKKKMVPGEKRWEWDGSCRAKPPPLMEEREKEKRKRRKKKGRSDAECPGRMRGHAPELFGGRKEGKKGD